MPTSIADRVILTPMDLAYETFNSNDDRIISKGNNVLSVLHCPDGFVFNEISLSCQLIDALALVGDDDDQPASLMTDICESDYVGLKKNPDNCRTFYSCFHGYGHMFKCTSPLIFNENTLSCEWPNYAKCCEYIEEDPDVVVGGAIF
ncbi:uncharacterized protein LOC112906360 [Agrilus planipennis]|uniref:Uncharacterized protein LOC112906360 n=1 Tax=Agrilus planipennis TaxID=224129 RepID=A0A7F5RJB2_AGRPL|nr:uncharacterized protein LOC112906360 [Agrilus planipennis]